MKLSNASLAFSIGHRALRDGATPIMEFDIKDMAKVKAFFNNEKVNQFLLGGRSDIKTCRLHYNIDETTQRLTIGRSVGPRTFAWSANRSLVLAVLNAIYDAPFAEKADIVGAFRLPVDVLTSHEQYMSEITRNFLESLNKEKSVDESKEATTQATCS